MSPIPEGGVDNESEFDAMPSQIWFMVDILAIPQVISTNLYTSFHLDKVECRVQEPWS